MKMFVVGRHGQGCTYVSSLMGVLLYSHIVKMFVCGNCHGLMNLRINLEKSDKH